MMLLNVWVPELGANRLGEICHAFVYRWLIGGRHMQINHASDPATGPFTGAIMGPILFPNNRIPVRQAGNIAVAAGDIVGFFDANDHLVHSMVASAQNTWVGANNNACFGTGLGRTTINNVFNFNYAPGVAPYLGWVNGNDNVFHGSGGNLSVYCRTPPPVLPFAIAAPCVLF